MTLLRNVRALLLFKGLFQCCVLGRTLGVQLVITLLFLLSSATSSFRLQIYNN
jgi:hypothetical protein